MTKHKVLTCFKDTKACALNIININGIIQSEINCTRKQ